MFQKINGILNEECGTKVEVLFPIKNQLIEDDSSDFYLMVATNFCVY